MMMRVPIKSEKPVSHLRIITLTLMGLALLPWSACNSSEPGRTLEFANLHSADKIEVRKPPDQPVSLITDQTRIQLAANFIEQYHTGWKDVWTGPRAPELILNFYRDGSYVGGFGVSRGYLVASFLSRDAPAEQISSLLKSLNLHWPSPN